MAKPSEPTSSFTAEHLATAAHTARVLSKCFFSLSFEEIQSEALVSPSPDIMTVYRRLSYEHVQKVQRRVPLLERFARHQALRERSASLPFELRDAIASLGKLREYIVLARYIDNKTTVEIAIELGRDPRTIRRQLLQSRELLKAMLLEGSN